MDIHETYTWIDGLRRFGIKPGLERTRRVLQALGNPEQKLRFYHVAGTNGKGSVCAMLAAMLKTKGIRVGVFTSPGLGGFNGRMTVDGQAIDDTQFARYATEIRAAVETVTALEPLTEFEVLTVMALLFFRDMDTGAVVWETGLGGRFDSTNVVTPVVTAITNVGYDHVEILGPTLADIARDKAGIIKPGIPVVTGADGEAYRIIEQVARAKGAPLYRVGCDTAMTRTGYDGICQVACYRGIKRDVGHVRLSLFGDHQLANAAVACAMFETQLGDAEWGTLAQAAKALAFVQWPLRFERFRQSGSPIIIDGAHNPPACRELAKSLREFERAQGKREKWRMLVGVLGDKDVVPMLQSMLPLASDVIVCKPRHPRAGDPQAQAELIRKLHPSLPVRVIPDVAEATMAATKDNSALAVWGSLYMVEDARKTIVNLGNDSEA